jgi:hypothetical protein
MCFKTAAPSYTISALVAYRAICWPLATRAAPSQPWPAAPTLTPERALKVGAADAAHSADAVAAHWAGALVAAQMQQVLASTGLTLWWEGGYDGGDMSQLGKGQCTGR